MPTPMRRVAALLVLAWLGGATVAYQVVIGGKRANVRSRAYPVAGGKRANARARGKAAALRTTITGSGDVVQISPGKRASARLRGKKIEALRPDDVPPALVRAVEIIRQNYVSVTYANGTVATLHSPSLPQQQKGEWLSVRAALEIAASEFAAARDEWRHATRDGLLRRKMGLARPFRGNAATRFGLVMEPRAIEHYQRVTGNKVIATGLHMHENCKWGASPDGIVRTADGEEGLLEVKCFFKYRASGEVPQASMIPHRRTPRVMRG